MGNSTSCVQLPSSDSDLQLPSSRSGVQLPPPSAPPSGRSFTKKRSAIFTRLGFGSSTANLSDTLAYSHHHSTAALNEKFVVVEQHSPRHSPSSSFALAYNEPDLPEKTDEAVAFDNFLQEYPEYRLTWILDTLRRTDFARLERAGETYVDYMGGSIYPESLVKMHTDFLNRSILGNTHSVSNSSKLSVKCADDARLAVLNHFNASSEYTVIFTANASGALKLVAESFPFTNGSHLVIGADSHNSVHGIREYASSKGGRTAYIASSPQGGFDIPTAKNILLQHKPRSKHETPSLFVLTAQSNITNAKLPLSITQYAARLGYCTVVDAAALAATSVIDISQYPIDAMAVSFYKMFGYPTGVGALIVKRSFLAQLKRPWFAGGNVDVVQVPGQIFTRTKVIHEQFEDGTINYAQLPAVSNGLRFLSAYLPFLPLRLSSLLLYLTSTLSNLRHDTNGRPVVHILSRLPTRRLRSVGEQSDAGSIVSMLFFDPLGVMMPNSFIEYAASTRNISLRTGCMCNPGGAAAILDIVAEMGALYPGVTLSDFEAHMGRELGVVRVSLGLASNFQDVWRVIQLATSLAHQSSREELWTQWANSFRGEAH